MAALLYSDQIFIEVSVDFFQLQNEVGITLLKWHCILLSMRFLYNNNNKNTTAGLLLAYCCYHYYYYNYYNCYNIQITTTMAGKSQRFGGSGGVGMYQHLGDGS